MDRLVIYLVWILAGLYWLSLSLSFALFPIAVSDSQEFDENLEGIIPARSAYVIANNANAFLNAYGFLPDEESFEDGPADANGEREMREIENAFFLFFLKDIYTRVPLSWMEWNWCCSSFWNVCIQETVRECFSQWTDRWASESVNERTNERMNERMDRSINFFFLVWVWDAQITSRSRSWWCLLIPTEYREQVKNLKRNRKNCCWFLLRGLWCDQVDILTLSSTTHWLLYLCSHSLRFRWDWRALGVRERTRHPHFPAR